MTLKIKSRSPKPNQHFIMSQCYIHANLLKIWQQVHEISCTQESVTPTPTPTGSAPKKKKAPLPYRLGDIISAVSPIRSWSMSSDSSEGCCVFSISLDICLPILDSTFCGWGTGSLLGWLGLVEPPGTATVMQKTLIHCETDMVGSWWEVKNLQHEINPKE